VLKPMDIHNTDFKRSFKGYNEEEVDAFVAKVVSHYESLYQENKRLQDEIAALQEELQKKQSREQDVLDLISLTKQTATEIRELSEKRSQAAVEEAQRRAATIIAEAEARIKTVQQTERLFKERMRVLMESTWRMLEDSKVEQGVTEETKVYRDAAAALSDDLVEQD